MKRGELVISRVWRSQLGRMMLFALLCGLCVVLSNRFPSTVVRGRLVTVGVTTVTLSLPLLWLLPLFVLGEAAVRMYDVRYMMDGRGIEAREGILGLKQSIMRVRFEDIRSVETEQTVVERLLNIGSVEIGTAATSGVEMTFSGIAAPHEVQEMIAAERDRRQRIEKQSPSDQRAQA